MGELNQNGANTIRVLTVDDHEMVRQGMDFLFLPYEDIEVVGAAHDGQEALRLCEKLNPDVILMDMIMPGMDGVAATQAVHQQYPQVQVLALTSFYDEDLVRRAMQAGAIGYLLKGVPIVELAQAIRDGRFGGREQMFVGFSDGRGPATANRDLSAARAESVRRDVERALAGNIPANVQIETEAFGEALPMACDDTIWGQQTNRRVELWVREAD